MFRKVSSFRRLYSNANLWAHSRPKPSSASLFAPVVKEEPRDWDRVISDAEEIVGLSSSLVNTSLFMSPELAAVAGQLRKIMHSNHPLLRTAK